MTVTQNFEQYQAMRMTDKRLHEALYKLLKETRLSGTLS
ncbi:hypothetical protein NOR53_2634 [gamma proteobacterium NOR5-3]|nr:hypothetical protein NOR53_2634 [gamma proteobacterium NOR5-3]